MTLWRPAVLLGVGCAAAVGLFADRAVRAAATPSPAISITRNTQLDQSVWPGDFNGDGKTDLVASDSASAGALVVALGDGDGTFRTPVTSSFAGHVLGVGDFNGDHHLDVIATDDRSMKVYIVPGNGDGTLGTARLVADLTNDGTVTFAVSADLDGNGTRDLVVGIDGQTTVEVFSGNGDFTFAPPIALTTNPLPSDAVIADFNGDGRKDLAVTNRYFPHSVAIFLNQGGFTFTAADISLDRSATDVTTADVNGDGKLDLIVSTAAPEDIGYFTEGYVNVLLGHGDGTFGAPTIYTVPPGPWQVVVGDFNRDGIVDIATANRSPIYYDDSCTISFKTWDTVSILPGRGDGTFDTPSSFSLGDHSQLFDDRYRESVVSLNTSDLNGDHQTDLIASWGAMLLNITATNRAPTVNAGTNQTFNGPPGEVLLLATASDPDDDMLTYSWTASDGRSLPAVPVSCVQLSSAGTFTFTVTVNDGHGHTASSSVTYTVKTRVYPTVTVTAPKAGSTVPGGKPLTITWTASSDTPITRIDVSAATVVGNNGTITALCTNLPGTATSCTWNDPGPATDNATIIVNAFDADGDQNYGSSGQFTISGTSTTISTLPGGWYHADIGHVGAAGSASDDGLLDNGDAYTVTGAGADIWGTADAFHYAWRTWEGDFQIETYVTSVQNVNAWTKAGLMVRETATDPSSRHASIFVTPAKGVAFQRRTTTGSTSVSTSGPALTAPVWLRLVREGPYVHAYYRKAATSNWTLLGTETLTGLSTTVAVGFAVTSHADPTLATAKFAGSWVAPAYQWQMTTIGAATGSASSDQTNQFVVASGADIWGTADAFEYLWLPWNGSGTMTVRVQSIDNTSPWAKVGLMFRESLAPGAKQVDAVVTPGKGVAMQYRSTIDGSSAMSADVSHTAPIWLRLQRSINASNGTDSFIAWYSTDYFTWIQLGHASGVNMTTSSPIYVGIAVTSHNTSASARGVTDSFRIQ